jgi:hypothetical protein
MSRDMVRGVSLRGIAACENTLGLYRSSNPSDPEPKEVSSLREMTERLSSLFDAVLHVMDINVISFAYEKKCTRDLVSCDNGIAKLEKALAGLERVIDRGAIFDLKTVEKLKCLIGDLYLDLSLAIRLLQLLVDPSRQFKIAL